MNTNIPNPAAISNLSGVGKYIAQAAKPKVIKIASRVSSRSVKTVKPMRITAKNVASIASPDVALKCHLR